MNKKALYSFFVGFILLVVVTIINQWSFRSMKQYIAAVDHSREVITSLERLSNHFKSAQIYSPNYKDSVYSEFYYLYRTEAEGLQQEINRLQKLVQYNPEQHRRLDSINRWINLHKDALLQKSITELVATNEGWRLERIFIIHLAINQCVVYELNLLAEREIVLQDHTKLTGTLSLIFTMIAVGLIAWTFISNVTLSRKRNWLEGFLESVLNTSQNGVVSYKAVREKEVIKDFEVEFANKAVKKLLGTNPQKIIGKQLTGLTDFVKEYQLLEHFKEVVTTGEIKELEVFYQRKNINRWFYVLLAKRGDDGITATFHDITDIKRYQGELKYKITELEQSNAELEQYAYAASHDLQEPLRKIQIFSNYLEETQMERLDEKGKENLGRIRRAAERMSTLIRDILTFSRIKDEDVFEETDLNDIVKKVVEDLDLMIAQNGATVKVGRLPVIEAVPLQMNQLFYNLINNALKFRHPNRTPCIQIEARELSAGDVEQVKNLQAKSVYYEITCTDNGIGFDQKVVDQIFGLFKRLGDRQEYPGSGIGLALCRKVVTNHNGAINAEGKQEKGAIFKIYLPQKQA